MFTQFFKPNLPLNRMATLAEFKNSVVSGTYMGANPLPFPSYILAIVSLIHKIPLLKYLFTDLVGSFTIFIVISQLITKAFDRSKLEKYNILDFLVISLFVIRKKQEVQTTLIGMIIFVVVRNLFNKNLPLISIFLSFLAISDSSYIPLTVLISAYQMWRITISLVSPNIKIKDTFFKFLKSILFILIIPLAVCISFLSLDILIRNKHSAESLKYSLEFQAGLKNFNIRNGIASAHEPGLRSEADLYVMDRSVISLINYKYRSFFKIDNGVKSTLENVTFCEIHKVHPAEFKDEEPRFIKNGDIVKFKSISSPNFLGWVKKEGKDKFRNISIAEFKEKEDFWVVETEDYLKARTSQVKFKSVKSNDYLCARKVKQMGSLSVSWASEDTTKIFYVAENANHLYYKTTFEDQRTKVTIVDFKSLSFSKMLLEHIKSINLKFTTDSVNLKSMEILEYFTLLLLCMSFAATALIFVISARYNQKTSNISERTVVTMSGVILLMVFLPFIGFKHRAIEILSLMFAASLAEDLLKGGNISLKAPNMIRHKKRN